MKKVPTRVTNIRGGNLKLFVRELMKLKPKSVVNFIHGYQNDNETNCDENSEKFLEEIFNSDETTGELIHTLEKKWECIRLPL